MRKLLLQLDSSKLPSVFDRVVAYDAGADEVMSYGSINPGDVRDLVYGCIFTRGPKDLKNTAVFIGGDAIGEGVVRMASAPAGVVQPVDPFPVPRSDRTHTKAGPPR